jgi:hypothetical protein
MVRAICYWLGCVMLKVVGVRTLEDVLSARRSHLVVHGWTDRIADRLLFPLVESSGCVTIARGRFARPEPKPLVRAAQWPSLN